VDAGVWQAAKAKRAKRAGTIRTRKELLAYLAEALRSNPAFNASDLRSTDGPSRQTYVKHFGSFAAALRCLGIEPAKRSEEDYAQLGRARGLGRHFRAVVHETLERNEVECTTPRKCGHLLVVNGEARVRVQVIGRAIRFGVLQWSLRKVYREQFDYVFIVRLKADDTVFDSMLLSATDYFSFPLWFADSVPTDGFEKVLREDEIAARFASLQAAAPRVRSRSSAGRLGAARRTASLTRSADGRRGPNA